MSSFMDIWFFLSGIVLTILWMTIIVPVLFFIVLISIIHLMRTMFFRKRGLYESRFKSRKC